MKRDLARRFRQEATEAERRLWGILRNKQFAGLRFRRQQPIGPFVVDFYCSAAKLIIELDGGQHADPKRARYDAMRTRWLEQRGYHVLRFWNGDILTDSEIGPVLLKAIEAATTPLPEPLRGSTLPQGEGAMHRH